MSCKNLGNFQEKTHELELSVYLEEINDHEGSEAMAVSFTTNYSPPKSYENCGNPITVQ